ncbi:metal ABC transporter substrate-binding protein [Paludibacterium paludis]|uniref:Metal ABC transporter substrate-binding protein n=1 Tax=Paludibacterium paludis TaxID=1225769 RepID=A0A918P4J8_9NEIS|nr:metal ABC transporter substrate-binding protein [Paludibacterium paludis]GGY19302.1 metal ABC transporter substrate-binding protein [Paludibacterium paludis]
MKRTIAALLCAIASSSALAGKLPVVASFSIVADLAREIGGDRVQVESLVGPDQDAHVYQPTPADIRKLSRARVFVVNGLGLEGWLGRLGGASHFKGVVIEAAAGVKPLSAHEDGEARGHDHDHGHGVDPHAWQDPQRVKRYVDNIERGFVAADPAGKTEFAARASALRQRIDALDAWAAKGFAAVPASRRTVLTSHDAFGYLADRYRVRFVAPQGVSTEAEASAKGVARLVQQIRKEKVRAVFFENMSDARLLKQIAREAGVDVSSKLYSDALSSPGTPADTWEKMFRYNVQTILTSLR